VAERRSQKRSRGRPGRRGDPPVSEECQRLLKQIRDRCPGLIPADPLPFGTVGPELTFKRDDFQRLVAAAANSDQRGVAVWTKDESELVVFTGKVALQLAVGLVLITIPVQCVEAGSAQVQVPFAVGDEKRPAGMFAATEERPRGPAAIVDVWGDALVAFAWKILLTAASGIAAAAGTDADGAGLIPAALTANADGMRVLTMSRHAFDRVKR
jgi:hypothetical protein